MKLLFVSVVVICLGATIGCPNNRAITERLDKIEAKIAQMDSRPSAAMPPQPEAQKTAYSIPVGTSPVKGNKDAVVAVTVFSDYQCPFCSRVDPLLNEALKDPRMKDQIKVVFKNFPLSFHQEARPAAKAALAAGAQGVDMYWAMSEKLFANQRELTAENFRKWATEIKGLDVVKWEKALKDSDAQFEATIKEDMELGMKSQVRGTPSIFVGGWELRDRTVEGIHALWNKSKG